MTDVSDGRIHRNAVVLCWGTPHETVGSLNEPREREENGVRFNEKWVYSLPHPNPDDPVRRVVYWQRYDFVASFLVGADGIARRDDPRPALARVSDREYPTRIAASERI